MDERQIITIRDGTGATLAKIPTDTDREHRSLYIERNGIPVYHIDIARDARLTIAYWADAATWATRHTDPEET
jgi:hypothetical protein